MSQVAGFVSVTQIMKIGYLCISLLINANVQPNKLIHLQNLFS